MRAAIPIQPTCASLFRFKNLLTFPSLQYRNKVNHSQISRLENLALVGRSGVQQA